MKRIILFIIAFVIIALVSESGYAKSALRIVSLAPSLTKNLQYLDADDLLVGCTSYCKPRKSMEVVASAVTVNIEKVMTLKPDLVVATTITKSETVLKLRNLGIRVEVFQTAKSFNDICLQFQKLGELIGLETEAAALIDRTKREVNALSKSVKTEIKPKIFIQIGANPLYAVYPGLFMNDYVQFAGGQNIAADLSVGSITREAVVMRNPDVIFVVTMGIVGDEEKLNWEKLNQLSATKNKKIFIIDSDDACTPTPISFVKTLRTIIDLTYKQ